MVYTVAAGFNIFTTGSTISAPLNTGSLFTNVINVTGSLSTSTVFIVLAMGINSAVWCADYFSISTSNTLLPGFALPTLW